MILFIQKLNKYMPIFGIFKRSSSKVFLALMLGQFVFSSIASANTSANICSDLFPRHGEKDNRWISIEAAVANETAGALEKGLKGRPSVPGVIMAILYAKSVAQDLQSNGRNNEAAAMLSTARNLNDWVGKFTDGTIDVMTKSSLDLPAIQATGAGRVVERNEALLDRVVQVEVGPASAPALVVAIEIAKMNATKLVSEGNAVEAQQIIERAKIADGWLGLFTDGTQSQFRKP